jgi:hypothetical protein
MGLLDPVPTRAILRQKLAILRRNLVTLEVKYKWREGKAREKTHLLANKRTLCTSSPIEQLESRDKELEEFKGVVRATPAAGKMRNHRDFSLYHLVLMPVIPTIQILADHPTCPACFSGVGNTPYEYGRYGGIMVSGRDLVVRPVSHGEGGSDSGHCQYIVFTVTDSQIEKSEAPPSPISV